MLRAHSRETFIHDTQLVEGDPAVISVVSGGGHDPTMSHGRQQPVTLFGAQPSHNYQPVNDGSGYMNQQPQYQNQPQNTQYQQPQQQYIPEQQPQSFQRLPPLAQRDPSLLIHQPPGKLIYNHQNQAHGRPTDTTVESQQYTRNTASTHADSLPQLYRETTLGPPPPTGVFDKIVLVYTQSSGTLDFMRNMQSMIFQYSNPCQPLIPVYLLVAGILGVLKCCALTYQIWPAAQTTSGHQSVAMSSTSFVTHRTNTLDPGNVACVVFDTILNLTLVIWTILGCIWIYGADVTFLQSSNLQYCDSALYHLAFTIITAQLVVIAFVFVAAFCLIVMVIMCASQRYRDQDSQF